MTDNLIPDLQVFSGAIELVKSGHPLFPTLPESTDEMPVVTVVASSTEKDLQGDTMAITALQDMCEVPLGQSVFLNHTYFLPDSFFGKTVVTPTIVQNSGVADLHTAYGVYVQGDAAKRTYDQIKNFGARHGVSGGFMVTQYSFEGDSEDSWFAPIIIEHLIKVEDSIVGIPANVRSWVEHSIEGLFERCIREDNGEEALRLAPAFKGLFYNKYKELAKSLRSDGLRKDLEARPIRSLKGYDKTKLFWEPLKKHFVFQQGTKSRIVEREEIATILKSVQASQMALEPATTKTATGKTSWPLMDIKTEWTGSKAEKQIFDYAKNDDGDIVASKAKQCFLYMNPDENDKQSGYKMPFCYVDGSPKIVPLGVRACANVLNGGMGGVDASDEDKSAMKSKVKTMYGRINSEFKPDPEWVVPWEKGDGDKAMNGDVVTKDAQDGDGTGTMPDASEVEVNDGKHVACKGEHSHEHTDMQNGDHTHKHTHNGDALHDHEHPEEDNDDKTDPSDSNKSGTNLVTLDIPIDAKTTDPVKLYQLLQLNAIGSELFGSQWHTLSFADFIVKEGRAINAENMKKLKDAHDILASMGGSEVCSSAPDNTDDDLDNDNDTNDGATRDYTPLFDALSAQTKALDGFIESVKAAKDLQVDIEAVRTSIKAVADSVELYQKEIAALNLKHKKAVKEVNDLAESVQTLKNMPLGDPTRLNRSVTQEQGTVDLKDFLAINKESWTLEEALEQTVVTQKTLGDGRTLSYRHWPSGVGGNVENGVRPALTNAQKAKMGIASWSDYESGLEALVPIVPGNDPVELLARQ